MIILTEMVGIIHGFNSLQVGALMHNKTNKSNSWICK